MLSTLVSQQHGTPLGCEQSRWPTDEGSGCTHSVLTEKVMSTHTVHQEVLQRASDSNRHIGMS